MIDKIYSIIWSDALVYFCLISGMHFSIRFCFPQITQAAWELGDIGVGFIAWLNLITVLLLHNKVLTIYYNYRVQEKLGIDPNLPVWSGMEINKYE